MLGVTAAMCLGACGGSGSSSPSGGAGGTPGGTGGGTSTGGQNLPGTGGSGGGAPTGGATGTGGLTGKGGGAGGATGGAGLSTGGAGAGGMSGSGGAGMNNGHFYVSPSGAGTACSSAAPCSIAQAKAAVRAAIAGMNGDFVVELADGVYRLDAPLAFTAADSGANGHTITWQAATGAHPVLSGGVPVTGWAVSNASKNIWTAAAPSTFATRQLYVDGALATRARSSSISRADMTVHRQRMDLFEQQPQLSEQPHPSRARGVEHHRLLDEPVLTDSERPEQRSDDVAAGVGPEHLGLRHVQSPYRQGPIYAENDLTLLDKPGEWYQDLTAGALYYIPLSGQDMTKVDVELPQLQLLVAIGAACPATVAAGGECVPLAASDPTKAVAYAPPAAGDPYAQPAHDIVFSGLTFSHTSWLEPNTDGLADQQTGGFLVGPRSNYPGAGRRRVRAARPHWHQIPAAVQVSAAKNISFVRDRFVDIGQVGLGIGNDANAHMSGVGLGANGVSVTGCVFTQIAGGAVVIGGVAGLGASSLRRQGVRGHGRRARS